MRRFGERVRVFWWPPRRGAGFRHLDRLPKVSVLDQISEDLDAVEGRFLTLEARMPYRKTRKVEQLARSKAVGARHLAAKRRSLNMEVLMEGFLWWLERQP